LVSYPLAVMFEPSARTKSPELMLCTINTKNRNRLQTAGQFLMLLH